MTSAPTWLSIRRSTVPSARHSNNSRSTMLCWTLLLFVGTAWAAESSLLIDPQQQQQASSSITHLEEQRNGEEEPTQQHQAKDKHKATEVNQNVLFQVQASVTVTLSTNDDDDDQSSVRDHDAEFVDFDLLRPWMDDSKSFILTIDELLEEGGDDNDKHTTAQGTNDPFQMEQPLKLSWEILYNATNTVSSSAIIMRGAATLSMLFPLEDISTTTRGSKSAADRTLIVTLWEDDIVLDEDDDREVLPPTVLTRRLANLPRKVLEFKTQQSKLVPVELHASGPFVKVQLDAFTTYHLPHFLSENNKGEFHRGRQKQTRGGGSGGWSWTLYGCTAFASWVWFLVSQRKSASDIQNAGEVRQQLEDSVVGEENVHNPGSDQEGVSVEEDDPHALAEKDQLSYEGDSSASSDCGSACKIDRPPKVVRDSPEQSHNIPKDLAFLSRLDGTPSSNSKRAIWKCDQNKDSKLSKRASKLPPKEIFAAMESSTVAAAAIRAPDQSKSVSPPSTAQHAAKMPAELVKTTVAEKDSSVVKVTAPVNGKVSVAIAKAQATPPAVIAKEKKKMPPPARDSEISKPDKKHRSKTYPAKLAEAAESERELRVPESRAIFDDGGLMSTKDRANATKYAGNIGAPSEVHDDHTSDLARLNLTPLEAPEKADEQGASAPLPVEEAAPTTGIGELSGAAILDAEEQTTQVTSYKRGRNTHGGYNENNNWLQRLKSRGSIHLDKAVLDGKSSHEEEHPSQQEDDAATKPSASALPVGNESSESEGSQDLGTQKRDNHCLPFASANVETDPVEEDYDEFGFPDSSDSPVGKPEGRVTPSTDGSRKRPSPSQSDTIDTADTAMSDVVSRVAKKRRKRRRISLDTADKLLLPGVGPSRSLKQAAENVMSKSWKSGRRRTKSKSKASSKSA